MIIINQIAKLGSFVKHVFLPDACLNNLRTQFSCVRSVVLRIPGTQFTKQGRCTQIIRDCKCTHTVPNFPKGMNYRTVMIAKFYSFVTFHDYSCQFKSDQAAQNKQPYL